MCSLNVDRLIPYTIEDGEIDVCDKCKSPTLLIQSIKEKWIKELGQLDDDNERNGYFLIGFLLDVLNSLKNNSR